MNQRLADVAARAKRAPRTLVTEAEDATSAFTTVTWTAPGGAPLQIRYVWNGGCCAAPEVHELLFAEGGLMRELVYVAPRDDAPALMRGAEAARPIVLEEVLVRDGRMVLWEERRRHHAPESDMARWREREARALDLARTLRREPP